MVRKKSWYRKDTKRKLEGIKPKNSLDIIYELNFRGVTPIQLSSFLKIKESTAKRILKLDKLLDSDQAERLKRYLDEGN